jgi:hypothetical protein
MSKIRAVGKEDLKHGQGLDQGQGSQALVPVIALEAASSPPA